MPKVTASDSNPGVLGEGFGARALPQGHALCGRPGGRGQATPGLPPGGGGAVRFPRTSLPPSADWSPQSASPESPELVQVRAGTSS